MLDYEILRLIWWALLGILLIGFAVMDGFDLGAAMLLPFVARPTWSAASSINTVGPVWEGNQVWLILGGGAIFAAWPTALRRGLLGLLSRNVSGAVRADPASGRLQVPLQARQIRAGESSWDSAFSSAAWCRR